MNKIVITVLAVLATMICLCACGTAEQMQSDDNDQSEVAGETVTGGAIVSESSGTGETASAVVAATNTPAEEINAWGDSITEGYGSDGLTYPDVLAELTGMPVINLGVGGEDSVEILSRSLAYGRQAEDILVIQMGDNGGWKDLQELIDQYRMLISEAGTERYIIISSTDDPDDFAQIWGYTTEPVGLKDTWYEAAFREAFGEHLLIGRKYLIENGLAINGLTETEEDRARAVKGDISLQLRNPEIDNTHLNEAGYIALAHGVYEKGQELGYWE